MTGEKENKRKARMNAIDTIEALQQENEQLRAKLENWKYEAQCHMDEVVAKDKEIEKLYNCGQKLDWVRRSRKDDMQRVSIL